MLKLTVGIYLSDLTYIDSAYPSTGSILENEQRSNLMNNILRIISDLQQSCEYDIPILPHVQKYLNSVQYIEELQKFVEDDNYNFIHKMNTAEFKSATFPNAGPRHLLDDSVMEPHAPSRGQAESSTLSSGISIGSSDGSELSEETSWPAFESSAESEDLAVHLYPGAVTIQGVLRRKTLLKEGKKPTVASWTKYWAALCGTQLFYYAAKSLKATERKHFKSTSNKNVCVVGWMVMMADDPEHPDLFLLTDSEKVNVVSSNLDSGTHEIFSNAFPRPPQSELCLQAANLNYNGFLTTLPDHKKKKSHLTVSGLQSQGGWAVDSGSGDEAELQFAGESMGEASHAQESAPLSPTSGNDKPHPQRRHCCGPSGEAAQVCVQLG
ncbi:Ral GEF with PH domain and SH3 binding motif 2 [Cricetulus griseus]